MGGRLLRAWVERPLVDAARITSRLDCVAAFVEDAVLLEEQAEYDSVVEDHGGVVLAAPEGNMGSLIRLDVTETSRGFDVVPSVVEVDHTVTPDPELRAVEERYEAEMAATLAEEIDYPNFKDAVEEPLYQRACGEIWGILHRYQK